MTLLGRFLRIYMLISASCFLALLLCPAASAHPIPKKQHDRIIVVKLSGKKDGTAEVAVSYRLEVDENTAVWDMEPFRDQINVGQYQDRRNAYYFEYTRLYAPVLANNLLATFDDGEPLTFSCTKRTHALEDEKGQPLGHLRCDFLFVAKTKVEPGTEHKFHFRDANWQFSPGKIDLSLKTGKTLHVSGVQQPGAELKKKDLSQLASGDDKLLRQASATFVLGEKNPSTNTSKRELAAKADEPRKRQTTPTAKATQKDEAKTTETPVKDQTAGQEKAHLVALLRDNQHAFWILLILSAFFGAAHALTPGHGKTLMAAYLVGEQGTFFHALILGLVTTLTHTGVVILFAVGLRFVPEESLQSIIRIVQLSFGGIIAAIGFWLLTCRLSGRADHVHIGGGHHHHHGHGHHHHHGDDHHHDHVHDHDHSHADHVHDDAGDVILKNQEKPYLGWWPMIVMGMQGGIVPCWDAVALLCYAVAMGLLTLALPMILAFSAGLALVLVVIGIAVVSSKKFAQSHWGANRLVRMLPIVSACAVIAIGIWLCYDSVHGPH